MVERIAVIGNGGGGKTTLCWFVDFPLHTHMRWAMKRQIMSIFRPCLGGPEGCPLLPMTWEMIKTIYRVHKYYRPRLIKELDDLGQQGAQIIRLQSPRQFRQFLRNPYNVLSTLARNPIPSDQ